MTKAWHCRPHMSLHCPHRIRAIGSRSSCRCDDRGRMKQNKNTYRRRNDLEFVVARHDATRWAFSENTDLSEVLLVARKKRPTESRDDSKEKTCTFINQSTVDVVPAREQTGFTQQQVAKLLQKPQSFVSSYERGQRRIDILEFLRVADVL